MIDNETDEIIEIFILTRLFIYIKSPDWIKKKKTILNPKNNYDQCFEYAIKLH